MIFLKFRVIFGLFPVCCRILREYAGKKKWKTQMLLQIGSTVVKHLSAGQRSAFGVWGEQGRKENPREEKLCLVLDLPVLQYTIFKAV